MKTLKAAPSRETLAITGQLLQIRYRHPGSDWCIGLALLDTPEGPESCTVVGALDSVPLRQSQTFYGYWDTHEKFGRQFHLQAATAPVPQSADGMTRYLATVRCPHLGPKTAEKLVAAFGRDTLTVLREHPEQVAALKGVTPAKATAWQAFFAAQRGADDIIVWLLQWDIDPSVARRLYAQYGPHAMSRVQDNPYQLTQDTWGVGFRTADRMALSMGWAPLSPERLAAVWRFGLETALTQGDCYQTTAQLRERAQALLTDQDPSTVQATLTPLIPAWTRQPAWAYDPATDRWQLPSVQRQERALSHQVLRHQAQPSASSTPIDWAWLETRANVQYAAAQRTALQQALNTPFSIVTGGPGTGKTTLLQGLLRWLIERQGVPPDRVALTAPTARAAQRMKTVTGHEALTIHRLLEWSAEDGQFTRQADNPLDVDWLIADEVSMIDLPLAQALWQATAPTTRVLWIGDAHQLPSVGPGSVLHDLIASGQFPVTALTHNFRSASSIAAAAHAWLQHTVPHSTEAVHLHRYPKGTDRTVIQQDLLHTVRRLHDHGAPWETIQVLCPMRRGPLGTDALNEHLRALMNPAAANAPQWVATGGTVFRVGDRVMQTKNAYGKAMFNGDIGVVAAIAPDPAETWDDADDPSDIALKLWVQFPDHRVGLTPDEARHLRLAYASTVHKSQGSEYPVVVMPMCFDAYLMLYRNLVYTGMTRAQSRLEIFTEGSALWLALKRGDGAARQTGLQDLWARPLTDAALPSV